MLFCVGTKISLSPSEVVEQLSISRIISLLIVSDNCSAVYRQFSAHIITLMTRFLKIYEENKNFVQKTHNLLSTREKQVPHNSRCKQSPNFSEQLYILLLLFESWSRAIPDRKII